MSKVNKSGGVLLFALALFIAYMVMPVVSLYISSIVRVTLLLIIIFLLIADSGVDSFVKNVGKLLPIYIIALMDIFLIMVNSTGDVAMVIYDVVGSFILSCVYLHIAGGNEPISSRHLLWVLVTIYCITAVTTIYGNILIPTASRQLATGMTGETVLYNQYRALNIGGFKFVYELVLVTAILPFVYKKNVFSRLMTLLFYVLILACVFFTEYTTAFLVVLLSGVFFFVSTLKGTRDLFINVIIIGALLIVFATSVLGLLSSIDSDTMSSRFTDILDIVNGSGMNVNSDVESRQSYFMQSFDAFMSNPISGTGKNGGGHSFILDNLAKFGLFGLLVLYIMFRSIFKRYVLPFKRSSFYGYVLLGFIMYVFLLAINPQPLYIGVTFFVPLIAHELQKQNNNAMKETKRL